MAFVVAIKGTDRRKRDFNKRRVSRGFVRTRDFDRAITIEFRSSFPLSTTGSSTIINKQTHRYAIERGERAGRVRRYDAGSVIPAYRRLETRMAAFTFPLLSPFFRAFSPPPTTTLLSVRWAVLFISVSNRKSDTT